MLKLLRMSRQYYVDKIFLLVNKMLVLDPGKGLGKALANLIKASFCNRHP